MAPVGEREGERNLWPVRWLGRLVTRRVGLKATGPELKRNSFQNKNWIFKFTKALEICTRRFRRNFDTRIFPKFF
jgi:hypothetical protein